MTQQTELRVKVQHPKTPDFDTNMRVNSMISIC